MKKKNTHNDLGFEVPDGYFESNIDRLFDLKNMAQHSQDVPFSVPLDYFDTLEDRVMNGVMASTYSGKKIEQPFNVPQGYFENLEHRVLKSINNQVDTKVENPFTTPQEYFVQLEQRVLEATVDKPVVELNNDYPSWVIPMLAVAAIFVAILAIDGFWPKNIMSMQDLNNEELALYISETDFISDQDAIDILYSDTDVFDYSNFETSVDNEALLDYLADEVEVNLMIEE